MTKTKTLTMFSWTFDTFVKFVERSSKAVPAHKILFLQAAEDLSEVLPSTFVEPRLLFSTG
jgi:hypothetical protein